MSKSLILTAIFFGLSACQTVEITETRFSCIQLDWFEIGRSDGAQGLASSSYVGKKDSCDGFTENEHEKYVNGWYSGVDGFCSKKQGYAFGKSGQKYLNICPSSKEAQFLSSYRKGIKVHSYQKDNLRISDELLKLSQELAENKDETSAELFKRSMELETRMELNKALISEIQKEADETVSFE